MNTHARTIAAILTTVAWAVVAADVTPPPAAIGAAPLDAASAAGKALIEAATLGRAMEVWKATATAYSGLWSFYVVGASAVLGFSISDKYAELPKSVRLVLLLLFAVFAVASWFSVWRSLEIYNAATIQISGLLAESNSAISKAMWITDTCLVGLLHITVDCCVGFVLLTRLKSVAKEKIEKRD